MKRKYFQMIESKGKTLEARLNYPFLRDAKTGDTLTLFWESNAIHTKINAIRHYNSFKEMLDKEDIGLLLPGFSKKRALVEYEKIYPSWKVKKNKGILVFSFEKF